MDESNASTSPKASVASFAFTGAGIGWLMGLSASPTLSAVLAVLLGVLSGLFAAVKGKDNINAYASKALAALVVFMGIFAPLGVWVRTNNILGAEGSKTTASLANSGSVTRPGAMEPDRGVLFERESDDCARLTGIPRDKIRSAAKTSGYKSIRDLEQLIKDDELLYEVAVRLCSP